MRGNLKQTKTREISTKLRNMRKKMINKAYIKNKN